MARGADRRAPGGGLALSLALALRDAADPGARMPAGIHVVSPFCDLAVSAKQLGDIATDPWFNRIALRSCCSISCRRPTARWPSSPRSRRRCGRADGAG